MEISLVMFKADGQRRDFPLTNPVTIIGRKPTCGLRIPLSAVSREHCQIEIRDDGLFMRDLGSSNGTFYNGERVPETQLHAGDRLDVGSVVFTVVIDGQPTEIVPISTILPEDTASTIKSHPKQRSEKPQALATSAGMPDEVEEDLVTPTTDLEDDDPIAALEALAAGGDDDDIMDQAIPLFDDDEDEDED